MQEKKDYEIRSEMTVYFKNMNDATELVSFIDAYKGTVSMKKDRNYWVVKFEIGFNTGWETFKSVCEMLRQHRYD